MVDADGMACLAGVKGGEGATGEDDEEVGRLERISELEEHDGTIRCGRLATVDESALR